MGERLTPVTIDMYRPEEFRTDSTKRRVSALMGSFLGRERLSTFQSLKLGETLDPKRASEIDDAVFNALRTRYKLSAETDTSKFYLDAQRVVADFYKYFGEILPNLGQDLQVKDEIGLRSDEPSRLFRLLAKKPENIDPTLTYEAQRHVFNLIIAEEYLATIPGGQLSRVLTSFHDALNKHLFEGEEGAGERAIFESFHDDDTNTVVGFPGKRLPRTAHKKIMKLQVRSMPGIGKVVTGPREKREGVVLAKSLTKALDANGDVDVGRDIEDGIGMIFVPLNPSISAEELSDKVVAVAKEYEGRFRVREIREEDRVDRTRGQSSTLEQRRTKIFYEGVSAPIELIFRDTINGLNSVLEVGKRDRKTGLYMGSAQEIYDPRRIQRILRIHFPEELYLDSLEDALVKRSISVARDLRERYRVD